jgi:hypothetical protein
LAQTRKTLHFGVGPLLPNPDDTKKAYMPVFAHLAKELGGSRRHDRPGRHGGGDGFRSARRLMGRGAASSRTRRPAAGGHRSMTTSQSTMGSSSPARLRGREISDGTRADRSPSPMAPRRLAADLLRQGRSGRSTRTTGSSGGRPTPPTRSP